jgi:hypothetical protein
MSLGVAALTRLSSLSGPGDAGAWHDFRARKWNPVFFHRGLAGRTPDRSLEASVSSYRYQKQRDFDMALQVQEPQSNF